jgi:hypothetical protein
MSCAADKNIRWRKRRRNRVSFSEYGNASEAMYFSSNSLWADRMGSSGVNSVGAWCRVEDCRKSARLAMSPDHAIVALRSPFAKGGP